MEFNYDGLVDSLNEAVEIEKGKKRAKKYLVRIEPVEVYSNDEIRSIRIELNMTQSVFATVLGVSKKTVEAWEAGINKPNGSALRLMKLLRDEPDLFVKYGVFNKDAM